MPKQTKALVLQLNSSSNDHSSLLNLFRIRFIQFSIFFLFAILIALTSPSLRAQDQLIIAGIQGSSQSSYSYLGLIQPLEKSTLGKGWYRKILISHLTYRYLQTNPNTGITIHATAPGIEGGFGHAWSGTPWSIDLSATVGYRNISLSPISPAADDKGGIFILNPQIQARYQFTEKLDADLLANHSLGQGNTYARERLGWRLASGMRIGPELIQVNGKTYHNTQAGLFASMPLANSWTVELSAGRSHSQTLGNATYGGIGIAKVF